jgi:hypothetical protein
LKNTSYIKDYKQLTEIYKVFQFTNDNELENWKDIEFVEKSVNKELLQSIMEKEGFLFLN